jgi:hypothetical protein
MKAKDLTKNTLVIINGTTQRVTKVTRRESHVYVSTDYTETTGAPTWDFDIMEKVEIAPVVPESQHVAFYD